VRGLHKFQEGRISHKKRHKKGTGSGRCHRRTYLCGPAWSR
jgi:hypothetical protein